MIITKIQGGLGNQIFQYAAGLGVAYHHHAFLKLDVTWFEANNYRRYNLSQFNISENFASPQEIDLFFQNKQHFRIKKRIRKFYNQLFNIQYFPYPAALTYYCEKSTLYDADIFDISGDIYLEGFWQSFRYILPGIEDQLRLHLTLKYPQRHAVKLLEQQIKASLAVAVHVRRGDYVSNTNYSQRHGFTGLDYYKNALSWLKRSLSDFKVYIFTDDPEWVQQSWLMSENSILISGKGLHDFEELYLMSQCDHQVIANSTLSWWGAWLNQNMDKIVIAPEQWLSDPNLPTHDIVPSTWIRLCY